MSSIVPNNRSTSTPFIFFRACFVFILISSFSLFFSTTCSGMSVPGHKHGSVVVEKQELAVCAPAFSCLRKLSVRRKLVTPVFFRHRPHLIASGSTEDRGDFFDSLSRCRTDALERRENIRMGHRRTEIGPTIRLMLNLDELRPLFVGKSAAGSLNEAFEIELDLLFQPGVQKASDVEIPVNGAVDLFSAAG